ncbi:hypothetical protein FC650_19010 [Vibrio natriegens]|uniref:hypothetical protein n=1 Tax=Vibrio natriegens TaxID=691 RepID=UPI001592B4B1|nr:hypothetical protein [Vibrio natriegens]NVC95672.1 hypothetical protein [Vibrio natriegens]
MMEHSIHSRHKMLFSAILIGAATLYVPTALAQDPGVQDSCMEDLYGKSLNCTANDINIAEANNIVVTEIDGQPVDPGTDVCVAGKEVTFEADFNVVATASDRYDIGLYFQNDGGANALNGSCNIYTLSDEYSVNANNTDGDSCWDVEQAQVVVHSAEITTLCQDTDGDGQLNLPNCVSWRQPGKNEVCNDPTDAFPGAPSKCNCDDNYNIPIFIQPDPPVTEKSVTPLTGSEPYQEFLYTITITPAASTGSLVKVTYIEDEVSSSTNIGDSPETFILNGGPGVNDVGVTKGKFTLLSSGLLNACESVVLPYVIPPESVGLECTYKIRIDDEDLPNVPDPELFENYVRSTIVDEYDDPVGDNTCVTPSTAGTPNPNCSNEVVVELHNVSPTISVTKSANPTTVVESITGEPVEYTVVITNTSSVDAVTITSITDDQYDITTEAAACLNEVLGLGETCQFSYTRNVVGNLGDAPFVNNATAVAFDNENDSDDDSGQASVSFSNSPGDIDLVKTPNALDEPPYSVTESGADVDFTFEITNTSPVDSITLTELVDDELGVIFDEFGYQGDCNFFGDLLAPGDSRFCTVTVFLSGEPDTPHMNTAMVTGETDDAVPEILTDTDNGKVVFIDEPADVNLAVDLEITVFLDIANASSYEPVNLNSVKLGGATVVTGLATANYEIIANSCFADSIAPSGTLSCSFTVDILTFAGLSDLGTALQISVTDGDGGVAAEPTVTVKAQLAEAP